MGLDYAWLHDTVRQRFDSDEAMEAFLPRPLDEEALRRKGDDRYLSAMMQRVFQAGMQHTMVDAKWPAFETVLAHLHAHGPGGLQRHPGPQLQAFVA